MRRSALRCPKCADLVHTRCFLPLVQSASVPRCPNCQRPFEGISDRTSLRKSDEAACNGAAHEGVAPASSSADEYWVPDAWELPARWWNHFWDSEDSDFAPPTSGLSSDGACMPVRRQPRRRAACSPALVLDSQDNLAVRQPWALPGAARGTGAEAGPRDAGVHKALHLRLLARERGHLLGRGPVGLGAVAV